jgi:hypothetical protein
MYMENKKIIANCIKFVKKNKCIISEEFIVNYYILTIENFISLSEENDITKINKEALLIKSNNKKYYKITTDCFLL